MPTITSDIHIDAQPDRVYETLLDAGGYEDWVAIHDAWPQGPPELTAGGSFTQAVNLMGRSAQIEWTVTEQEPPSTLSLDGQGPMGLRMRSAYRLYHAEGGTALRYESEIDGGTVPLGGRLGQIFSRKIRAVSDESLTNLKARVETNGRQAAAGVSRQRRRRTGWKRDSPDPRMLAAIEENTRAVQALTEQLARANEQVSPVAWLTAPLDPLRRSSVSEPRHSDN